MTKTKTVAAMTSTGKDDWHTPPLLLERLDDELRFSLDAAAASRGPLGLTFFGPGATRPEWEDALAIEPEEWALVGRGGAIWLNPPYSRAAGRGRGIWSWHRHAFAASQAGATVVVLCPPHPGRAWFHEWARRADEVRFYKSRVAFVDPATGRAVNGNTQDSCLVIYRPGAPESGWPGGPRMSWIDVPRREPGAVK